MTLIPFSLFCQNRISNNLYRGRLSLSSEKRRKSELASVLSIEDINSA
jgi:hypothetical protein